MNVVKELVDERFQERVDKTIKTYVKGLDHKDTERILLSLLDDYYNNVASHEEREAFLLQHEELPF